MTQAAIAQQKSVTIELSNSALAEMKNNNYRLCFAKKVAEGDYNVVWQSYDKYLANNTFTWTPQFQLFGTNTFQAKVEVHVDTNFQTIGLGETCILDSDGNLGAASTGGPDISLTMVNQYGAIHPGVNQLSIGLDGKTESTPIYVAPVQSVEGTAILTPVEKVLVWFEQNIATSTMFSDARSNAVEIDLTFVNDATRLYDKEKWSTPSS